MSHPAERFVAPMSIQRGQPLKDLFNAQAVDLLAESLAGVVPRFRRKSFTAEAVAGLEALDFKGRAGHLAAVMARYLATDRVLAAQQLIASMGPPLQVCAGFGLKPFFYLPHSAFIHGFLREEWQAAMDACYALTMRFSAEFAIRPYLQNDGQRTLAQLAIWAHDANPHVRRLVSEGSRPRLPWGERLPQFMKDPSPLLPLLEMLKDDSELYVRRSVANHLGDIAKDHLPLVVALLERWLGDATAARRWLIRHALRHPAKHGNAAGITLRRRAGAR